MMAISLGALFLMPLKELLILPRSLLFSLRCKKPWVLFPMRASRLLAKFLAQCHFHTGHGRGCSPDVVVWVENSSWVLLADAI